MKFKPLAVTAVAVAMLGSAATGCGSSSGDGDTTLTFSTYAWQKPTVKATDEIVAAWNAAHPRTKVKVVYVDAASVHDKLVTQFGGGRAPDVIHAEAADLGGFADQGYLADLKPLLSDATKGKVSAGIWNSVTYDGKAYGMPTLLQSYNVFVNTKALAKAGVQLPAKDEPWTWDDMQAAAKKLTAGGRYGLGWGLKSPVSAVMSLSLNFGGSFSTTAGGKSGLRFGDGEKQVLSRMHTMIYSDKSLAPASTSMSTGDVLPGFYAGKYAMLVAGNFTAQQIVEQAPDDFGWKVLPPLTGTASTQAANPQTLSVAAQSEHPKEAARFIEFYAGAQNLAKLAQGDWLIPATGDASKAVLDATNGADGWDAMVATRDSLTVAEFQKATNYPQWKSEIATPAFQEFFADRIDIDELGRRLRSGWDEVNAHG